jgi:hypothetical protein
MEKVSAMTMRSLNDSLSDSLPGRRQGHERLSHHRALRRQAGKDGQKTAGHTSEGMTKNYQRDHEEIVWLEAIADLNISEITGRETWHHSCFFIERSVVGQATRSIDYMEPG